MSENNGNGFSWLQLHINTKNLAFFFTGLASVIVLLGSGFLMFNNEVCKPVMQVHNQKLDLIIQLLRKRNENGEL